MAQDEKRDVRGILFSTCTLTQESRSQGGGGGSTKPDPGGDVGQVEEKKKKEYIRVHKGGENHRHRQNSRRGKENLGKREKESEKKKV